MCSARRVKVNVRKMFVLEVWSPEQAQLLKGAERAKPAEAAPEGIYSCNFPSSDGGSVELLGVLPSALASTARSATFAYLTARAKSHLKP